MYVQTELPGNDGELEIRVEFNTRKSLRSARKRHKFLSNCIEEQVIPKSAPKQLHSGSHPFKKSARLYLEEACADLACEIEELRQHLPGVHLPHNLVSKINAESKEQETRLQQKLKQLCTDSPWKNAGRRDLVNNLSRKPLDQEEEEALSLGLKFDIGEDRNPYTHYFVKNTNYRDSDIEKGFKQGVTACCKALSSTRESTIPKRYRNALRKLGNDDTRVITQADKGGGVIIMDKTEYDDKMMQLLEDETTYTKKSTGFCDKEAKCFNTNARAILSRSTQGKKMLYLLEEAPRPPRMRGLPKVHKPGIPMRPITSGIGSAPHQIAKILARPLSKSLGSLSGCHLTNSNDLLNRLKHTGAKNKKLASFDVKSLFTNVPIEGALNAAKETVQGMEPNSLPLPAGDMLELIGLCVRFGSVTFENSEYCQHSGLAMGSPLSPVLACLFMEMLEKTAFKRICGTGTTWCRYVDDVLIIMPRRRNLQNLLEQVNAVHPQIQFTMEEEQDNQLPFLDVLITRRDEGFLYQVYRKPTNKNDFVHYLSGHDDRTKSGTVIGFYLRAMRVCSDCFVQAEYDYIKTAFMKMGYPTGLLHRLQRKATSIHRRQREPEQEEEQRRIVLPTSAAAQQLVGLLPLRAALASGTKTGDLVRRSQPSPRSENSVVYKIPCAGCPAAYIGETGRGIKRRLREHQADMTYHRTSNAMVSHADNTGHLPNWSEAETLHAGMKKQERKALEAAHIASTETTNTKPGNIAWAPAAAALVLQNWKKRPRQS